jgi:hypothetical protein
VQWDQLAMGLETVRAGLEVSYVGLSGPLEFDLNGKTPAANTKWWTIAGDDFADLPATSDCR